MPDNPVLIYYNAMELLVAEEVRRQFNACPANLKQYINPTEVATYALNRLPPLYASSQEGLKRQRQKAVKELSAQIRTAVRQGFAAIQRDPLRQSIPLTPQDSQLTRTERVNLLSQLDEVQAGRASSPQSTLDCAWDKSCYQR